MLIVANKADLEKSRQVTNLFFTIYNSSICILTIIRKQIERKML